HRSAITGRIGRSALASLGCDMAHSSFLDLVLASPDLSGELGEYDTIKHMLAPSSRRLSPGLLILVGMVLPAAYVALNSWLVERSVFWLMAAMVVEVGLLGFLCGRLVEPSWLRWIIYGWVWVLLDFTVVVFTSTGNAFRWDLAPVLATSLIAAQVGLVTI